MVSFFGLRLGGNRKKSQDSSKLATNKIQHLHRNDTYETITTITAMEIKRQSNFSRPQLARPGTSHSTLEPPTRVPYKNSAGAASSMVDLSAPRAPGMGNPRFHTSDIQLNTRFGNGSSTSLVAPSPINADGNRPGTPTRPGTAVSTKGTPNPFNIHFGKDSVSSIPNTPLDEPSSHSDQFEFNLGTEIKDVRTKSPIPTANNGYPSPPPSIVNAERPFSPDNRPSSSRQNVPTAPSLHKPSTAGPMSLPSPAVSVARSEEVWESPVIRNVSAKRDTFTFHMPRRQSFTMETDPRDSPKPMAEGLAGNFTGFDFGETVRKGSIGGNSIDTVSERGVSPIDTNVKPKPLANARTASPLGTTRTASPLRTMQSSPSLSMLDTALTRTRTASDAMSPLSLVSSLASAAAEEAPRIQTPQPSQQPKPMHQAPKILQPGQLSEPIQNIRPVSPSRSPAPSPLSQPPQQNSPGPSPILASFPGREDSPLLNFEFPRSPPRGNQQSLAPSPQYPPKQYKAYQPPNSSPPTKPLPSPYRSPTAPLPPVPPPRLNPGTSRTLRSKTPDTTASADPGFMSRPLEPPPRGFRARTDSEPKLGRPLRVPALADRSATIPLIGNGPRSAVGTGFDDSGFVKAARIPEPPRTASPPFLQQSPMEGDFPIQKGLPRGRRPQQPDPQSPERGFGLEPRKQRRQPPVYPPPRDESPVRPMESFEHPSTPNWNDFDRAEAHKSAIPAALSPFRTQFARSPTQATDSSLSPRLAQYASSPISDTPPSLPSPSFPSLQKSISNSSENMSRAFDFDGPWEHRPEPNQGRPLISPVMVDFVPPRDRDRSRTRVEAKRAPPRPSPITVPQGVASGPHSLESARARTPNPVVDANNPGFI
ncbi:uncharacterized protein B0J16DRAFT_257597 [Fusarium flagelliforme]|uniref:uncharacterized protein n=1 Tax=Fusarium flagelliforme TaxID=2675880 RepID=UPI001E8D68D7|nr:uncharacterized protein B0J16DRAFT_257597 [Fusarium flagelliforme]KAH7196475.1 hypothetical protein B0J16DRAFT_257597 [Fusarium flagelliforme]